MHLNIRYILNIMLFQLHHIVTVLYTFIITKRMFGLRTFYPSGHLDPRIFNPCDLLSLECSVLQDILSLWMFCPLGVFVRLDGVPRALCLRTFCMSTLFSVAVSLTRWFWAYILALPLSHQHLAIIGCFSHTVIRQVLAPFS